MQTVRSTRINALLACGIAASLLYVVMNIVVAMQYPGYSSASQTVSELSAIDAPSRGLWVWLGAVHTVLTIAFGWGVWRAAGESRALRFVGAASIAQGVLDPFWPPMHQRQVLAAGGGTLTDTLHIVFTAVWGVVAMLQILCAAAVLGREFRLYSIVTLLVILAFGAWTGIDAPHLQANEPTPWIGVIERVNIGAYMLWAVVLAVRLMRIPGRVVEARSGANHEIGLRQPQ